MRWRLIAGGRALKHDGLGTRQGRVALALGLIAAPGICQLIRDGGPMGELSLSDASRLGALIVAELGLTSCLVVMIPVTLARRLVLSRDSIPLSAHPGFLPEGLVLEVLGCLLGISLFLWGFFHVFYVRVLLEQLGGLDWAVGAHLFMGILLFLTIGIWIAVGAARLPWRGGATEAAGRLQVVSVLPFLLSFPLFALLPRALYSFDPELLGRIPGVSGMGFYLPLAVGTAMRAGRPALAAIWIGGLFLASSATGLWLLRSRRCLAREVSTFCSRDGPGPGPLALPFRSFGSLGWTHISLFWIKDLRVRGRRRRHPAAWGFPWVVLLLSLAGLTLAPELQNARLWLRFGVTEVLAGAMILLATYQTLGTLGTEGPAFPLLSAILPMSRLYVLKTLVNLGHLLAWGSLYAVILGVVGPRALSQSVIWMHLISSLFMYSIALSVFGTALGFLLPDFRCRSLLLPGSTRGAQLGFLTLSPILIASTTVSAQLESAGVHPGFASMGGPILPSLLLILISLPVVSLALTRTPHTSVQLV